MRILVTQRVDVTIHGERRDGLDQNWTRFLSGVGALAVPVPNESEAALALAEAVAPAGLLLSGGNDLAVLGGDAPERDATEEALVRWALARRAPVLGVCRGMQFLAARFGARLAEIAGHVARPHPIRLAGGTTRMVNSFHRWGVAELPADLLAVARAEDGWVEAFRHAQLPVAGLMWHPERDAPFDTAMVTLFQTFFSTGEFLPPCEP